MTALSAAARRSIRDPQQGRELYIPMNASTTIYQGGLVCWDADGYARAAADTASFKIAGVALETVTNSGADGAASIRVVRGVTIPLSIQSTSITIADIGYNAIVQDDNTVTDATTATNDIPVGVILDVDSTDGAWVCVGVFAPTNAP